MKRLQDRRVATTFSHLLTDAVIQHMTYPRTSSTQMRDTGRRNFPIAVRTSSMRILPSFLEYTFSTMPFGQQSRANCRSAMTTTSLTLISYAALNHLVRRVSAARTYRSWPGKFATASSDTSHQTFLAQQLGDKNSSVVVTEQKVIRRQTLSISMVDRNVRQWPAIHDALCHHDGGQRLVMWRPFIESHFQGNLLMSALSAAKRHPCGARQEG